MGTAVPAGCWAPLLVIFGRFGPAYGPAVRACRGPSRAGNGHSRAQRRLCVVPGPIWGATEPQRGVSVFFWLWAHLGPGGASLLLAARCAGSTHCPNNWINGQNLSLCLSSVTLSLILPYPPSLLDRKWLWQLLLNIGDPNVTALQMQARPSPHP